MSRRLHYLATPYSHPDNAIMQARFERVTDCAAKLMSLGLHVYSPITHGHVIAAARRLPTEWEFWRENCLAFLERCDEVVVLMQDGWQDSIGVSAEILAAKRNGITRTYIPPREVDLMEAWPFADEHFNGTVQDGLMLAAGDA